MHKLIFSCNLTISNILTQLTIQGFLASHTAELLRCGEYKGALSFFLRLPTTELYRLIPSHELPSVKNKVLVVLQFVWTIYWLEKEVNHLYFSLLTAMYTLSFM